MSIFKQEYNVMVIGAGVAGSHAAISAATRGAKTLLMTSCWDTLSHLGWGPDFSDASILEKRGSRLITQSLEKANIISAYKKKRKTMLIDNHVYQTLWKKGIENTSKVYAFQDICETIDFKNNRWSAQTRWGLRFVAQTVVIAVGTFLGSTVRVGLEEYSGGRPGEKGSTELLKSLEALGLRFFQKEKQSAPILLGKGIDWEKLKPLNTDTRDGGIVRVEGPRGEVCLYPTEKNRDQFYLKGLESADKISSQEKSIAQIRGLEETHLIKAGYATSFYALKGDCPSQEELKGLYFAGKVSGCENYVEAANQGILVGESAAKACVS